MKLIWKHSPARFKIGFVCVSLLFLLGFVVTIFYNGADIILFNTFARNLPPSAKNPLGTTALGQDTFWMLLFALRNSMIIGIVVAIIGTVVGVLYGLASGFTGGAVDRVMMALADTFIVIPSLPVLILMTALTGSALGVLPLALILSIFAWAHPSRHVRAICLSMRERDFIQTARFSGEGMFQIIVSEILPYLWTWALSNFMNALLVAIGQESTLAVLGLASAKLATLGSMIQWARSRGALLAGLWIWIGSPIIVIIVLFISLFMLISGYNEYFAKKRGV